MPNSRFSKICLLLLLLFATPVFADSLDKRFREQLERLPQNAASAIRSMKSKIPEDHLRKVHRYRDQLTKQKSIRESVLLHVRRGHFFDSSLPYKSKFYAAIGNKELTKMVRKAIKVGSILPHGRGAKIIFNVGKEIGVSRRTGRPTRSIEIIVDKLGNIKTVYPK